ncbi:MAG: HAMP domain-containing histidine kinase [Verrucomicrobia bacterium]|nr:HAMP domain-containing histidine kinase [Verrucomicrobiota bacterium]MCH8512610.1 HAMP domain-containing histidine kinase [Kiritimatiellia bacterium]
MSADLRFQEDFQPAVKNPRRKAAVTALIYVLLCSFYILYSGKLAEMAASGSTETLKRIESLKGILFVLVTGFIFFLIIHRQWKQIRMKELAIIDREHALVVADRRTTAAMSMACLAHDLNNFLMVMEMSLEELNTLVDEHPQTKIMIQAMSRNKDNLQKFTERIKQTISVGYAAKDAEETDLNQELEAILTFVRRHPDMRNCKLNFNAPPPLKAHVNRALMNDAISNLLINAAQSAVRDKGEIQLNLREENEKAILEVHDNGPGIPENQRELIFEPCFTTKPNGTGLGMLSVKAFALSARAKVEIDQSPLGGALIRIKFPLRGNV